MILKLEWTNYFLETIIEKDILEIHAVQLAFKLSAHHASSMDYKSQNATEKTVPSVFLA